MANTFGDGSLGAGTLGGSKPISGDTDNLGEGKLGTGTLGGTGKTVIQLSPVETVSTAASTTTTASGDSTVTLSTADTLSALTDPDISLVKSLTLTPTSSVTSTDPSLSSTGTGTISSTLTSEAVISSLVAYVLGENRRYVELEESLVQNNPNLAFRGDEDDVLQHIFRAIALTLDDYLDQLARVQRDIHVRQAEDEALDALGTAVNTRRPTGEGDDQYRTRVFAGYGRATSKTVIEDFVAITKLVLQADADDISLRGASDRPVVIIEVDVDILKESLFTQNEIVDLLKDSVASGHNIELETVGTFEFDGDNYTPSPNSGFNEGSFGGTISG